MSNNFDRSNIVDIRKILEKYYPFTHRYIENIDRLLDIEDYSSEEFSVAVGVLGWSGMGSFIDQVFCDVDRGATNSEEFRTDEIRFYQLMKKLGEQALKLESHFPNREAITSMVVVWEGQEWLQGGSL